MYTCVNALLRERGMNQRITQAQVGNESVRDLVSEHSLVVLVLTHPSITYQLSLNMADVEELVNKIAMGVTVDDWLNSLGTTWLPTSDGVPVPTAATVAYNDAWAAGYSVELVHPLAGEGSQLPDLDKTDLLMTRVDTDYQQFYDHVLVSVNGLFHQTDASTAGVKVMDGGRSVQHANKNMLGLVSFLNVGKVSTYPLDVDHIIPRSIDRLADGFTIRVPGVDLSSKVAMLCLGGVLHFANDSYQVVGPETMAVDWKRIPFAHRYYDTKALMDWSAFERTLVRNPLHGDALDMNQAMSNASILAFLLMSQTFVVTIDVDNFYYERHMLEHTALPGRYYNYTRPSFPMQLDNGLFPPYIAIPESGIYSLAVDENFTNRYVDDLRPSTDDNYWSGARVSHTPVKYSNAYLLEMGTELLGPPITP